VAFFIIVSEYTRLFTYNGYYIVDILWAGTVAAAILKYAIKINRTVEDCAPPAHDHDSVEIKQVSTSDFVTEGESESSGIQLSPGSITAAPSEDYEIQPDEIGTAAAASGVLSNLGGERNTPSEISDGSFLDFGGEVVAGYRYSLRTYDSDSDSESSDNDNDNDNDNSGARRKKDGGA